MSRASDLANLIASGNTTIHGEAGVTSSDSTGKTTNLQQGLLKAWQNYDNNGTPSLRDSFNNSSITDNAVGDTTLGFTNSFSAVTFAFAMASSLNDSTNDANIGIIGPRRLQDTAFTTSSARVHHIYNSGTGSTALYDNGLNGTMFSGDLA